MIFKNHKLTLRTSLNNIQKLLPEETVLQANRSLLVNPHYIQKIIGNQLFIAGKEYLVSKNLKDDFNLI
jgi:DNA-binding LytR/AlgR family response regulator